MKLFSTKINRKTHTVRSDYMKSIVTVDTAVEAYNAHRNP